MKSTFGNFRKVDVRRVSKAVLLGILCGSLTFAGCRKNGDLSASLQNAQQTNIVLGEGVKTSYADVVEKTAPSVVRIRADRRAQNRTSPVLPDFFNDDLPPEMTPREPNGKNNAPQNAPRAPKETGLGSGVIITTDGIILTNHHVVDGAETIRVDLTDKRSFQAKLIGSDAPSDLAVLKIEGANLPTMPLGDSDKVRVGDVVLAIGNPLGLGQTVTSGIISAKGRSTTFSPDPDKATFEDFLQTDAPINRGNSGGALVSLSGELIGINSQILSPSGGNIGIGFAIPSSMAKSIADQILKTGKVRRGQLGIVIQPVTPELADNLKLSEIRGVIVSDVRPNSAAERAGIQRGDIVLDINGKKVDDGNDLRNRVAQTMPGEDVKLKVLRKGSEVELTAKLDEFAMERAGNSSNDGDPRNPGAPNAGENVKLGVTLAPNSPELGKKYGFNETKGLVVTEVDENGAAADANVNIGDVILQINGQEVSSLDEAHSALNASNSKNVLLLLSRRGQTIFMTVETK